MKNKAYRKLKALFFLAILVMAVASAASNQKTYAAGETFKWTDFSTITGTGGDFKNTVIFKRLDFTLPGTGEVFSAQVTHKTGCIYNGQLSISGPQNGFLTALGVQFASQPGTPVTEVACQDDVLSTIQNLPITILGTRSAQSTTAETSAQKSVNITLVTTPKPEASITVSLTKTGGAPSTQTVTLTKTEGASNTTQSQYQGSITLEAGAYTCATTIPCGQIVKVQYVPLNVTFSDPALSALINVTLNARFIGGGDKIEVPAILVTLKDVAGTVVQTAETNAVTLDSIDNGTAQADRTAISRAAFAGVPPGQYLLCVLDTVCKEVTKVVDKILEVSFDVDGQAVVKAGGSADNLNLKCDISLVNPLTWLVCPIINAAVTAANKLDSEIDDQLTIKLSGPDAPFETGVDASGAPLSVAGTAVYKAWSAMRTIALSLLLGIAIIMVLSQAFSYGPFDAYTVKKVLPRIVIAVIGITLSWQLTKLMIGISNDLGQGIGTIISQPFASTLKAPDIGNGGLAIGNVGLAAALVGGLDFLVVGSLVLVGLAAILTAFLVITFRNIFVFLLVIFAPIAIVFWILPNTAKAFKFWKENFQAVLLAFPIIVAFISMGRVFAALTSTTDGNNFLAQIIVFIAYFGPYFALPAAFKLAGGAIASLGGMANDRSKGFFDKQRKFRGERKHNVKEQRNSGNFFKGAKEGSLRAGFNKRYEQAGIIGRGKAGFNPRQFGSRMRTAGFEGSESEVKDFAEKSTSFAQWKGDDAKLWAAKKDSREDIAAELERFDADRFAGANNAVAREDAVNQIMRTKREVNNETFQKARLRAQAGTGTGYIDPKTKRFDASLMLQDIADTYGEDANGAGKALAEMRVALTNSGQMAGQAGFGTWAGALSQLQAGNISSTEAHNRIMDNAADSVTPGQAMYGKPSSARELAESHTRRINKLATGVQNGTVLSKDYDQAVASTMGLYDAMAQSASPQNAREFADGLIGNLINDPEHGPQTVLQVAKNKQSGVLNSAGDAYITPPSQNFEHMRRDYSNAAQKQAAGGGLTSAAGPGGGMPSAGGGSGANTGVPT